MLKGKVPCGKTSETRLSSHLIDVEQIIPQSNYSFPFRLGVSIFWLKGIIFVFTVQACRWHLSKSILEDLYFLPICINQLQSQCLHLVIDDIYRSQIAVIDPRQQFPGAQ